MSEPIRTSPAKRKQLAAALKRNMARRKAASSHPSPTISDIDAAPNNTARVISHDAPHNGRSEHGIGSTDSKRFEGAPQ